MTDNLQDNRETVDSTEIKKENIQKFTLLELQQKYGIGRNPLYARMTYLKMTSWKVSGKAYLDTEQVMEMDGLHEHIQSTGRMEGYPVPPPSGPVDTSESTSAIAVVKPEEGAPTRIKTEVNYTVNEARQAPAEELEAINKLVESAQGKAAGIIVAENVLARQYLQNPEFLSKELQQKIQESAEIPVIDPFAYAESLINSVRNKGLIK